MIITHKITMDLTRRRVLPMVEAVQDDKYSRNLEFTLLADGEAWEVPEGTTAVVRFAKADGTGGNYDTLPDGSAAYTINGNVVTVALAPQVCTAPGPVRLAVGLINDAQEINTFDVCVHVWPNPGLEVTSEGYYQVIGALAASGWEPNMYLGTDAEGNVAAVEAPKGWTAEQVTLLATLLSNIAYIDPTAGQAAAAALTASLKETAGTGGSGSGGDSGSGGGSDSGEDDDDNTVSSKDISWEDGDGITLTAADLMTGYQLNNTVAGVYFSAAAARTSYVDFDIPIEYGYIYTFSFESDVDTVQIGTQFYNEKAIELYNSGGNVSQSNIYDPGWQENGVEVEAPEYINGSPVACVRLTFRKDTSNSAVTADMVTSVTITRKAVE